MRMRKQYYPAIAIIVGVLAIFGACKKNVLSVSPYDSVDGQGLLKINYSSPYYSNPGVMVKINGNVVSSLITYSTPYPGGGLNTGGNTYADYLSVKPGADTISLVVPISGTSIPDRVLFSTVVDIKPNVFQTLHITDTGANTKTVITYDYDKRPDSGRVLYRFVNLMPNSPKGIDLFFDTIVLAKNIGYLQMTDTFGLDAGNNLFWKLKLNGDTTTLTSYQSASSVANQRVFTIYARGYYGLPSTDIRSNKISWEYNK